MRRDEGSGEYKRETAAEKEAYEALGGGSKSDRVSPLSSSPL